MKTLLLSIIVMTGMVLIGINFSNVYAPCPQDEVSCGPPPGVTVAISTDNGSYEKNDTINVKGWVYLENYQKPVQVQVINPANSTIQNYQAHVDNGTFNLKINANFGTTGLYRIVTCINSWCDGAYFKFVAEPYKLSIDNKDFLINYKTTADLEKIRADIPAKSIRLHVVNATADAHKITIELLRSIIDSKSQNNADMNFTVLVGENQPDKFMQNANFKEIATTSYSRTLQIDIPYDPIPDVQGIWDIKITGTTFLGTNTTILSPLKQFKSGTPLEDIQCKQSFILFFKAEDHSPACITIETADKLSQQKWLDISPSPYDDIVRKKTKEFVLSSPTFKTFGIEKTLLLDKDFTCILTEPLHCLDQAFFDATHLGYGNGINSFSPINQTIHHNVAIRIYNTNQIECAIIDGVWDEKNQRPLEKNDASCGFLFGFKGGLP